MLTPRQVARLTRAKPGPTSGGNVIWTAFSAAGQLDTDALRAASQAVLARHESLRSQFVGVGPDATHRDVHVRPTTTDAEWAHVHDTEAAAGDDGALDLWERWSGRILRPFDLHRDVLFRVFVVSRGDDREHLVALVSEHIAADAMSMGIVAEELAALYNAIVTDTAADLGPVERQYADFVAWQRAYLSGPEVAADLAALTERFGGRFPTGPLGDGLAEPSVGHTVSRLVARDTADAVQRVVGRLRRSPFAITAASVAYALLPVAPQPTLMIPFHGRLTLEYERSVGNFSNVLPVQVGIDPDDLPRSVLGVADSLDAVSRYAGLPFASVAEALGVRGMASPNQRRHVFLSEEVTATVRLEGCTCRLVSLPRTQALFDLSLWASPWQADSRVHATFKPELVDPTTVTRVLESVETFPALVDGAAAGAGHAPSR